MFDAYVTAALFDRAGRAAFALGDGTVRFEDGAVVQAHEGAALCAVTHPSGEGVVTGGDDGRLVWSRPNGSVALAEAPNRWIEAVAASGESGLIAFTAGRDVRLIDVADPAFSRTFAHERTAAEIAFDGKGRRLAVATYGGVALWFARIADQKAAMLRHAGSHVAAAFSPDGRFVVTAMQENALHAWRLADGKSLRMGGYPAKPKSLAFLSDGRLMVSSGAKGAVVWPFGKADGPMGKQASEIGYELDDQVVRVAATPRGSVLAAGVGDGRVWVADVRSTGIRQLKTEEGPPISALAVTPDGRRLAWGDEDGGAGVLDVEPFG